MPRTNIEAERGRLMMSKQEFCEALGIKSATTYRAYIAGGNIPSDVLIRMRELTGKSIDYLLALTEE